VNDSALLDGSGLLLRPPAGGLAQSLDTLLLWAILHRLPGSVAAPVPCVRDDLEGLADASSAHPPPHWAASLAPPRSQTLLWQ